MTVHIDISESVSPIDEFRTRVFWRWNTHRQALSEGKLVDSAGQPVTPDSGVIAHALDSVDLFLRGHVTGQHTLRSTNTHVQHLLALCQKLGRSLQFAYEEVFWLIVDAYKDLIELELYEMVPTLKAALDKITRRFFKHADHLTFPEDPHASQEQHLRTAYQKQIEAIQPLVPIQPIDYLHGLYNRHPHAETIQQDGGPVTDELMKLCHRMDDIADALRGYLITPRGNLRRVFAVIEETKKQFPDLRGKDLRDMLVAMMDQDFRNMLVKYEIWEVMARFEDGWAKIKKRYHITT